MLFIDVFLPVWAPALVSTHCAPCSLHPRPDAHQNVAVLLDVPPHELFHQGGQRDHTVGPVSERPSEGHEERGVTRADLGVCEAHNLQWSGCKPPPSHEKIACDAPLCRCYEGGAMPTLIAPSLSAVKLHRCPWPLPRLCIHSLSVWPHMYLHHLDPRTLSPYTTEFWPERWLLARGPLVLRPIRAWGLALANVPRFGVQAR